MYFQNNFSYITLMFGVGCRVVAIHCYRPFWVLEPEKGPVFKSPMVCRWNSRHWNSCNELDLGVPMACQVWCAVFCLQYIHICYIFIYRSRWTHEFPYIFFCLKILFNVNGKATVWLTHPLFSFVCFIVMLRASKQKCLVPCSWYHWKALDEYGYIELVS
jgi:hypothetical protein